jgi:MoaA/NifB/PqqE/SkfB family radical SAM enzyme/GT2 family glycosyltransferase
MDISIIVPTCNRNEKLAQCLESLFKQNYPPDRFEIIVVIDGKCIGTEELLEKISSEYKNLRYVVQQKRGPAAARNLGVDLARGEIVGFTDDDCILDKAWIKNMVDFHRLDKDITAVGGMTEAGKDNINALVSQFLANGAIKSIVNNQEEIIFLPTCNVSFKRSLLEKEKFDERFCLPAGEDLEYFWRLFNKGHRFLYKEEVKVLHNRQSRLHSFLKQAYMYGRGNLLVKHLHRDQPLLKELKTESHLSFISAFIVNFLKIPRFSYILGTRLINSRSGLSFYDKVRVYFYFALHKVIYLAGNISEYKRISRLTGSLPSKNPPSVNVEAYTRPEFIILDITHRCNLACNICEIRKDPHIKEFTTSEIFDLIKQAIDWGVKEFVLSGGEPFTRGDIFEILDFVKEKKYHIGVLTNGIVLNGDFLDKLSPYLISNSLSLSISLDALTPEIHDAVRGAKGCFVKTIGGLRLLSVLKQRHSNINFNTISIILNENLEELVSLADFLKSLNVNTIQFQPLLANNLIMKERSDKAKYWIPEVRLSVLDRVIDELIEFKRNNFNLLRNSVTNLWLTKKYFRDLLTNQDIKCLYGIKTMLIANNGSATTCFDAYGDVRKMPLKRVFNSSSAQRAREKVKNCKNPCLLPCFTDN